MRGRSYHQIGAARRPLDRPVPCIFYWQFHVPQSPGGFGCGARSVSFCV